MFLYTYNNCGARLYSSFNVYASDIRARFRRNHRLHQHQQCISVPDSAETTVYISISSVYPCQMPDSAETTVYISISSVYPCQIPQKPLSTSASAVYIRARFCRNHCLHQHQQCISVPDSAETTVYISISSVSYRASIITDFFGGQPDFFFKHEDEQIRRKFACLIQDFTFQTSDKNKVITKFRKFAKNNYN